jgi:hypothetical protein
MGQVHIYLTVFTNHHACTGRWKDKEAKEIRRRKAKMRGEEETIVVG